MDSFVYMGEAVATNWSTAVTVRHDVYEEQPRGCGYVPHSVLACIYTQRQQMSLSNEPSVCVYVCMDVLWVLVQMWITIVVYEQSDATPLMYPSPKMGQMHEQEMKSLNLVVGNGIRKRWPFAGSLRPWSESHDSRIFTVPLVTGLVKSQHTPLKPSRPQAGLQLLRHMKRCFFPLF